MPADSIQFDDIARIFEARDAQRKAKMQQGDICKPSCVARHVGISRVSGNPRPVPSHLEYIPLDDEFKSETKSGVRKSSSKKPAKSKRNKGKKNLGLKNEHGFKNTKHRKKLSAAGKLAIALGTAFGIATGAGVTTISNSDGDRVELTTQVIEPIEIETKCPFVGQGPDEPQGERITINDTDYVIEYGDGDYNGEVEIGKALKPGEVASSYRPSLEARLDDIFANDPEAKTAFNDIQLTIDNIADELGEDAVEFLRNTRDTYAPNVSLPLFICLIQQESDGYMRNPDGTLLVGRDNDTGFGQITPICEEDVNTRLNPDGVIRHKEDPRQNLEIAAISLQDHCKAWGYDVNGSEDKNAEVLPYVLSSYNAGIGSVKKYGIIKRYVRECFEEHLSYMLKYPEFQEYFGCEDFID